MRKVKRLSLILGILMIMATATGCMQFDIGLEFNSDNTGKVTSIVAMNSEMFDDEDSNSNYDSDIDIPEGYKGEIEVITTPITYEEDGMVYEGGKSEAILSDVTSYIEANGDMKFIDLPNGLKRLEMSFDDEISAGIQGDESTSSEDGLNILSMLKMTGGKIQFTLKTDYKVVNHNATRVENGVYIWDLLEMAIEENETGKQIEPVFLEYETNKKESIVVGDEGKLPLIKGFKDLSKTHWAYNDIMTLVNKGIISGVKPVVNGVGEYAPNDTVSLGQFLAISTRLVMPDEIPDGVNGYHWAAPNYWAALDNRMISEFDFGSSDEELNAGISREDMAQILVKVAEVNGEYLKIKDGIENNIRDYKDISKDRAEAVKMAYSNGLLVGDSNGNYNPKATLTRAEVAAVFCRVMNYTERPLVEVPRANPIILPVDPVI